MKRKWKAILIALGLVLSLLLLLTGCNNPAADNGENTDEQENADDAGEDSGEEGKPLRT